MISTLHPPNNPLESRHHSGYSYHPTGSPSMSHYGAHYQSYPPSSRMMPHPSSYASAPPVSAPSSVPHHSPAVSTQASFTVPPFYNAAPPPIPPYSMQPPYAPASQTYSSAQHSPQQPQPPQQPSHGVSEGQTPYSYYEHYSTVPTSQMPSQMVLPSHASGVQPAHPPPGHHFLHPAESGKIDTRVSRSTSLTSSASSMRYNQAENFSRSTSPSAAEMANWGFRNEHGTWSCAFPGCTSKSTFQRGCDLRKHYRRHTKTLFCRHNGCPQATEGGFSSKKDRARHEAKHNPQITCEWPGCDRLFSRLDNMKDHVRRIHKKPVATAAEAKAPTTKP
ncbi:hypothetical protein K461DRAFT_35750 [Myriangium duriaei CBS 260.36]|uniref:C2H2-type domain-containing protein n=1 Tax=Myriangium duriaei CBS 260.36 TaxID=1168546 RepID=A0A9P4IZX0_9PEZI|nr:hypothetical protein K461DRAFT_35750 [Myriangium duriaei CBS 260.36]